MEDGFNPATGLITFTVRPPEEKRRLDVVLAARYPAFSRTQLARLAKEGQVRLDDQPARARASLAAGQTVTFPPPQAPLTDWPPEPEVRLEIIYEDDQILVVNKPWGLAVHPAPGYRGPTLTGGLLARDGQLAEVGERHRPGLVHRLDKDTSGVLVTAKTETALRSLAASFSRRETKKCYLALVRGRPARGRGQVELPIGRHPTQRHKMAAGAGRERPARTIYRVLRHFPAPGVSLVMLQLVTGRTHQARVHLQSLGTPVLADPVYSRGVADLASRFPQLAPGLNRQMLHARRLTISHPATGRPVTFRAPWPPDFLNIFRELLKLEK
ncbi:MAG: RluA family pseudouridine synthase [Candidatus Adiutrix sp.]|jgi:23S rRNA pseudouridine1911/1915/1917 synthase|nr:RluA family pseudouridine synthase [Candidatus Adiutrix sp.]